MSATPGQPAPEFTLFSSQAKEISLSDYKGKNLIILFFPLAFTNVCTEELCGMRDALEYYHELEAEVVAISVDSPFALEKYRQEQSLNFPLLSDFNKEVSEAYGCLYDEFVMGMKGVSKRAAFIVDKNGIIQYSEILENAGKLPDFSRIQSKLKIMSVGV